MPACPDFELALSLHAAQALDAAERAPLEAHLASCAPCARELLEAQCVLAALALPAPSHEEQAALASVPRRVQQGLRSRHARPWTAALLATALAAGVAALLVPPRPPPAVVAPTEPPLSESALALEAWAGADPMAEVLEPLALAEERGDASTGALSTDELSLLPTSGDFP